MPTKIEQKAFLLLLFPVVVASCSGIACPEEQDHSELMQHRAAIKVLPRDLALLTHAANHSVEIDDTLATVLKDLKQKASEGGKLPADEQNHMAEIKRLVDDQLLPALWTTRNDTEKDLNTLMKVIHDANVASTAGQQVVADTYGASVTTERADHKDCRRQQVTLCDYMKTKCDDLDSWLQTIHARQDPGLPLPGPDGVPDATSMGMYLKEMEHYCGEHATFIQKNSACQHATNLCTDKTTECNRDQTSFEEGFCMWRTAVTEKCAHFNSEYQKAVNAYSARENEVRDTLIPAWKNEYTGILKIDCYLQIWLSDNDVTTVDQNQADFCDGLSVDDTVMEIDFKPVPQMVVCDESQVANYPCTAQFLSDEYAGMPVQDCLDCPVLPTPTAYPTL